MDIDNNKSQRAWKSIKEISNIEGSPCLKCLVRSTCTRSFINKKDGCDKFACFARSFLEEKGIEIIKSI